MQRHRQHLRRGLGRRPIGRGQDHIRGARRMLSQHDGRPEPPSGEGEHRNLPVQRQVQRDRVAGADAVFELQQVGDLRDPVVQGRRGQFHPIAGAEIVEGDDRSGRVMS